MDTASYIIFKDGNIIYAKNGITGKVEFQGSDASVVIQSAIDTLTNGGKIFIKAGTYTINSNITVPQGLIIEGEGEQATMLGLTGDPNFNGLTLMGGTKWTILRNFGLYGGASSAPTNFKDGIVVSGSMVELNNLSLRNFNIY